MVFLYKTNEYYSTLVQRSPRYPEEKLVAEEKYFISFSFSSRLLFSISIHALFQTIEQVKRRDTFTHGFRCLASLLRPTSRGTLRIRSADPFEYPALDPHYLENPEDLAQLVRGSYSLLVRRFVFQIV